MNRYLPVAAITLCLFSPAGQAAQSAVSVSTGTTTSANRIKAMKAQAAKDPEAVAVDLGSPEPRERGDAAQILGRMGPAAESAAATLAESLADFSSYAEEGATHIVSIDAAQAIRAINPKTGIPPKPLQRLVRAATAPARQRLVTGGWVVRCNHQSEALSTLTALGPLAQSALPDLALMNRRPCTEGLALETALAIGPLAPEQLPRLVAELNDPDAEARRSVAEYLGAARATAATAALGRSLGDTSPLVRLSALEALEKLHPEGEGRLPLLKPYLQDDSPMVRRQALRLLTKLAPEAPVTLSLLNDRLKDSDPAIALESARAILKAHPQNASWMDTLIRLAKDTESETGIQAAELLKSSGRQNARIDEALEPYRERERQRMMEKALTTSTPEERADNARTLRVLSIRIAKDIKQEQPDHPGRLFNAATKRVVCWTEVSVATAPAVLTYVWVLDGKPIYETSAAVVSPVSRLWSSKRIKPGKWHVDIVAPGSGEPLASASFTVVK